MASPVLFTVEGSDELIDPVVELAGADLPRDLATGTQLRKTITRYAGTYTTVQTHGVILKPIELEGTFDDTWIGSPGHALEMKETIEAIVDLGKIVRFEYDSDQLWGTLDADFRERRRDRIEYTIRFEPFWREDPTFGLYVAFAEPPNDLAENLSSRVGDLVDHLGDAPDGVSTAFVTSILLDVLSVQNKVSSVLGYVVDVASYADLTTDVIALVTRTLFGAARTLDFVADKMKGAGDEILDDVAAAKIRGGQWIYEGSRRARVALQDLIAMLRKFLTVTRPVRARLHTIRAGDTLPRLAEQFLGDFTRWTEIADANDLETSSDLVVGEVLRIPPR